jgi:protein TonB
MSNAAFFAIALVLASPITARGQPLDDEGVEHSGEKIRKVSREERSGGRPDREPYDTPPLPSPPVPPPIGGSTDRALDVPRLANPAEVRPTATDYPPEAWIAGEEGEVTFSLTVGPDGKAYGCAVFKSSGSYALDGASCPIVRDRGIFEPARNEDGVPYAARFTHTMRWYREEPNYPGRMTVSLRFLVDETGQVRECEVLELSGEINADMLLSIENDPCLGQDGRTQVPYRDKNGVPVARRVTVTTETIVTEPASSE